MRRFHLLFAWILFLVAPAAAVVQDERSEQMKILEEGKKHIAAGHFPEAIAAFDRLKQMAPLEPQAYFFLGIAFAESGHLNAAAAELSEAVRLGPEKPEHALALGNVLTRLGQKRAAIRVLAVFDQRSTLNRLSPANLSELMKIYFGLEMTSEALRVLDEITRCDPANARVEFYRGKIYRMIGNLDLAQQAIEKSLAKAPANPADYFELGNIYEQRGLMAAAKKAFSEALKQRENDPETLYALGSVCLALDETDEAVRFLKRAEPAAVSLPKIYYALSQAYLKNGNTEKAVQYLNQQKAEESNLAQRQKEVREHERSWLANLAKERLEQGNATEAQALFQQLSELNSDIGQLTNTAVSGH
jgi:tetratricopeptide (TPR) repeat protein